MHTACCAGPHGPAAPDCQGFRPAGSEQHNIAHGKGAGQRKPPPVVVSQQQPVRPGADRGTGGNSEDQPQQGRTVHSVGDQPQSLPGRHEAMLAGGPGVLPLQETTSRAGSSGPIPSEVPRERGAGGGRVDERTGPHVSALNPRVRRGFGRSLSRTDVATHRPVALFLRQPAAGPWSILLNSRTSQNFCGRRGPGDECLLKERLCRPSHRLDCLVP